MLDEYALVPDIFDGNTYSAPNLVQHFLDDLKEPLLNEALVRDLRGSGWSTYVKERIKEWHPAAKELFTKLLKQNRLFGRPAATKDDRQTMQSWCEEAIASHLQTALSGIVLPSILL